jgi:anion-transporting  ArsA/GET3 family ATPase
MERASRHFLLVAGKGGVGKTTVCAAKATALAAEGKRVLVAMCNAKERLSTMLGSDLIGSDVSLVAKNVWAVNMDPEKALEEYGMMTLKVRALYKAVFDNRYTRTFFRAVPGIHDWSMLGKAWWHTTEKREDGNFRFDVVILDAPATGHGLDMLRVPKVIVDIVPPGLLRRDAERAWSMLQDPKQTGIVLVTLPEEMPTTETIELAAALRGELKLPLERIIVNGVLPPLFSKEERKALAALTELGAAASAGDVALVAARERASRESMQADCLARLTSELGGITPTYLPLLLEDAATPSAIGELAKRL